MPNTPAAIGRGSPLPWEMRASLGQRTLVHGLLSAVGAVEWVDDEALMDAVTALSGSGPAYVFLLAEAMAKAASRRACRRRSPPSWRAPPSRDRASCCIARRSRPPRLGKTSPRPPAHRCGTRRAHGQGCLDPLLGKAIAAATRRSRELAG